MIDFTRGGLVDIWPDKESPQIQALSYALQQALVRVKQYADQAMCYSEVDNLPESALDYFAVEMRAMYYEQELSLKQKREIVKNTLKWYTYAGTAATVADMVGVIFGEGKVVEWFDYTDPPYTPGTFDILTSARLSEDIIQRLESMIAMAKNVRSHIRGVVILRDIHADTHLAIHQVAVQECTALNIIREDQESGQSTYAAALTDAVREYQIHNHIQMDAGIESENNLVAYGSVTNNTTFVTNEASGASAAHSGATVAQIGNVYNTTSFIKEEKK